MGTDLRPTTYQTDTYTTGLQLPPYKQVEPSMCEHFASDSIRMIIYQLVQDGVNHSSDGEVLTWCPLV